MADKTNIEKAAQEMLIRYGDSATREIDLRILELQQLGQLEAGKFWSDVRKIILDELRHRKKPN